MGANRLRYRLKSSCWHRASKCRFLPFSLFLAIRYPQNVCDRGGAKPDISLYSLKCNGCRSHSQPVYLALWQADPVKTWTFRSVSTETRVCRFAIFCGALKCLCASAAHDHGSRMQHPVSTYEEHVALYELLSFQLWKKWAFPCFVLVWLVVGLLTALRFMLIMRIPLQIYIVWRRIVYRVLTVI